MKTAEDLNEIKKRNQVHKLYLRGVLESQKGNHNAATICFEQLIVLDPDFPDAYRGLSLAYRSLGDSGKAQEYLALADKLEA